MSRRRLAILRRRCADNRLANDQGNAIVEFVFVAVVMIVPLMYVIVAIASVQRAQLAVTNAAREAGRAFATGTTVDDGLARAQVAARIAFSDAGLTDRPDVRIVSAGGNCTDAVVTPTLNPGAEYTVCVTRQTPVPAVPSILQGHGITTEARYLVHIDDYRKS